MKRKLLGLLKLILVLLFRKQVTKKSLPDPFPKDKLRGLDFGNADGHRDRLIEDAFVLTSSVSKFLLNKQAIVVGPIGSGKSALFNLLKKGSQKLPSYEGVLVVPVEEAVSFKMLKALVEQCFPGIDEKMAYQLIWKFQITTRMCEVLAERFDLSQVSSGGRIKGYLSIVNGKGAIRSVVDKLRSLVDGVGVKFETKIAETPISAELKNSKKQTISKVNLDDVLASCSAALAEKNPKGALVIVDKIDKFVAGEEYNVQRKYIECLLEVEDDISSVPNIDVKVFLRSDLFARLDFSSLGYDKVHDNVVRLEWSNEEMLHFVAQRIAIALRRSGIVSFNALLNCSDLSECKLTRLDMLRVDPDIPEWIRRQIAKRESVNQERTRSLFSMIDRAVITKVFPRSVVHINKEKKEEEVSIFEFVATHFRDGHNVCTPRYLLIFLKEVLDRSAAYYDTNPDQLIHVVSNGNSYEWTLFKKKAVYDAYMAAKNVYAKNVGNVDERWAKMFATFLARKGNKTRFDYKWMRTAFQDVEEQTILDFMAFLQVIGYLKIAEKHPDIKKRGYELPIIYMVAPGDELSHLLAL